MLRWQRCARRLTLRSVPRRSRRGSSYRSKRRSPRSRRQTLLPYRLSASQSEYFALHHDLYLALEDYEVCEMGRIVLTRNSVPVSGS